MPPFRTAEVRWFQPGPVPPEVEAWFDRLGPAVERQSRVDRYLAPTDAALGVKLREGALEPKRRTAVLDPLAVGRAEATAEAWAKWSFELAEAPEPDDGWVEVRKTRRQRRLEAADGACTLELAAVTVGGGAWWSVCLEAEGESDSVRRAALDAGARQWLGRDDAPALPASAARGYPVWLLGVAR